MYDFWALTKRHTIRFLRDRISVFFSFLSVIILLVLYFLFLGKQYTNDASMDGLSENLKSFLTIGVTMGGVLVVNTLTLSLGIMGNIVNDLEQRRLDGFLVTPVKRYKIIASYYLSAILVTAALSIFMWVLTVLYTGISTSYWYSFATILKVTGLLILFTFISSSLMIFLTSLLRSMSAFGTLSSIVGTLIGFICGIYIPLAALGQTMTHIASIFPFTHMTIWMRQMLLAEPFAALSMQIPAEAMATVRTMFGTDAIGIWGWQLPVSVLMIGSVVLSFGFLVLTYFKMTKKMRGKV